MDNKNDDNLAEKAQDGAEMRSNADSDFVQADLADFGNEQQRENQQPNTGQQQNVIDWTISQSTTADDNWKNNIHHQMELVKTQCIALQNKCDFLEEKMNCIKLEAESQKEKDKKENEQLKSSLVECQEKMAKMMDAANEEEKMEQMKRNVMMACEQKMETALKEQIDQLKMENAENQKKLAEANQRAEEEKTAHCQQIDQFKCDLVACQQKMAEMEQATVKKWLLCNPQANKWAKAKTQTTALVDGHIVTGKEVCLGKTIFAVTPFSFADGPHINLGVQLNYFEVKTCSAGVYVGLSIENNRHEEYVGNWANSYSIKTGNNNINNYLFSGSSNSFVWPLGAVKKPILNEGSNSNVYGCGVLIWPNKAKRSIFFTVNGTLMGKHIPIGVDGQLYPAVSPGLSVTLEANFGDDPTGNPFAYDVTKCAGLGFGPE